MVPFYSLVATSLYDPDGSVIQGYDMTWAFGNYVDAIQDYWRPLVRSLVYGGIATLICLVLGYVLAYAIAFKSGRWKNLMLVLVIAPFFTSFLVRTLSWKLLLRDDGFIVNTLQFLHIVGARRPAAGDAGRRHRRAWSTTSCRSWCCRCSPASTRSTTGSSRPRATSTRARSSGSSRSPGRCRSPASCRARCSPSSPPSATTSTPQLLGSPSQRMIGNVIQNLFTDANDYPAAGALSVMLMLLILVMVLFYVRRAGTEELL